MVLPIVPYRNWNNKGSVPKWEAATSNRTLQELKLVFALHFGNAFIFQSYLTGIETKLRSLGVNGFGLPIVPYRNWNICKTVFFVQPTKLPIVPYRNWNKSGNCQKGSRWSSNRTLQELKHPIIPPELRGRCFQSYLTGIETSKLEDIGYSIRLPIVPYRNWNSIFKAIVITSLIFQSYLTGIETVERKYAYRCWPGFQSYLTGIETPDTSLRTFLEQTSNRTLQELKLYINYWCFWIKNFQSYLTGIET